MKFSCVKKDLELGLNIVNIFTGKNLDLPVLSCVLLESKQNFLKISSTNINTACEYKINIKSNIEGKIAVDSDILLKTISNIKDDIVNLELKNNNLYITTNSIDININTVDYSDFPSIPLLEKTTEDIVNINILKSNLLQGLNSTYYAASKSNIKPELASIFINFDLNNITFVATDGFRLSEKKILQKQENQKIKILLPLDTTEQFIKIMSFIEEDDLEVYISKNQIFIQTDNFNIFSRLTNGDFVDYKKLIPEEATTSIIFLKQDFLDISKLVYIFTNDFNQIKIIVNKKEVLLSTKNKKGNNNIKLLATIQGKEIDMNFNYKYILEAFNSIKTDSVEFIFNENKPLIIKPVGEHNFQYIVMPLSK